MAGTFVPRPAVGFLESSFFVVHRPSFAKPRAVGRTKRALPETGASIVLNSGRYNAETLFVFGRAVTPAADLAPNACARDQHRLGRRRRQTRARPHSAMLVRGDRCLHHAPPFEWRPRNDIMAVKAGKDGEVVKQSASRKRLLHRVSAWGHRVHESRRHRRQHVSRCFQGTARGRENRPAWKMERCRTESLAGKGCDRRAGKSGELQSARAGWRHVEAVQGDEEQVS
jgi:hypothetical protein